MRKAATSPGIAGNDLNRCDAPALQHKIRAEIKRTAVFFANSRLRVVRMRGGGRKRVTWDSNKERFVRIKDFLHIKRRFLRTVCKAFCKRKPFGLRKWEFFADSEERHVQKKFLCVKKRLWVKFVKLSGNEKLFGLRKRPVFSAHAKLTDKEKLFLSAPRQQLRTAPKLTCSHKFCL